MDRDRPRDLYRYNCKHILGYTFNQNTTNNATANTEGANFWLE